MFRALSAPFMAFALALGLSASAQASWQSHVLLIGVDGASDGIARYNQPFLDLTDALAEGLKASSYIIFTENTDKPRRPKDRHPRGLHQTIAAVEKLPNNRVDFAVLLSAKREVGRRDDQTQFAMKVIARLVDPVSGDVLETIKVKSQTQHIDNQRCGAACMRNATFAANDTIAPFLALRLTEEIEAREHHHRAHNRDQNFYEYDEVDNLDLRRDLNG